MNTKTFHLRLAEEAREARTGNGEVYLVRLLRPASEEFGSEAYERLGRAVPIDVLQLPGCETWQELGAECWETPWVAVLHGEGASLIPLSRIM